MKNVSGIIKHLQKERDRVEKQLAGINAAITAFADVYTGTKPARKKRKLSAAGRARIVAGQRKRWAKVKKAKKKKRGARPGKKSKRAAAGR
jgi:hypothetical protein